MSGRSERLKVVFLPPIPWGPDQARYVPGEAPNPFALSRHLADAGIDTTLIDPGGRPWNPFAGRNTLLEALDPWRALRVLLRERRADLVVSVFEGPALPLLLMRRPAGFRPPIALWDIGLTETWRLRERVLDQVVPRADAIMVLSASQASYIRRRWNTRARIEVIHHLVDTDFFRPAPLNPAGPVLSIGEDVGRDFATLNRAAWGLDLPVVVKTRRGASTFGGALAPNLQILDRWMSHLELRSLYEEASMVVVPLTNTLNASGVSTILETMATGRPLIVSDSAAIRDFILPGESCLTVPHGDAEALAAAIRRLRDDPALAARLAARGRALAEERFAIPVFAANFGRVLRSIAGNCRG